MRGLRAQAEPPALTSKQRLAHRLMSAALGATARLPLPVLYRMADAGAWVLRRVVGYRRKIVRRNLQASFPDLDARAIDRIERGFYTHLADVMVESVKLLHISNRTLDKRVEVVNAELINRLALEQGKPIILFLAHYGNWEWVPDVARFYSPEVKSYHVYKALRDRASQLMFDRLRSRFASQGIEQTEVLRAIIAKARKGEKFMCGFISDQRANWDETHHRLTFMGQTTQVLTGAEALGSKIGAAFVYLDVEQPRRGHYRMTFREMTPAQAAAMEQDMPYTRLYYKLLEESIRRQPHLWLWSHRRWLYQ